VCNKIAYLIISLFIFTACSNPENKPPVEEDTASTYLDFSNRDDQFTGGIKMIPITTPIGDFKVWTKRVGNNPKISEIKTPKYHIALKDKKPGTLGEAY